MSGAQAPARRTPRLLLAGALAVVATALTALVGVPAAPAAATTSGTPTAAAASVRARVDGLASLRRLALASMVTVRECSLGGSSTDTGPAAMAAADVRLDRPSLRLAVHHGADAAVRAGDSAKGCPRGPPGDG